jgi:phosphopantothenate---cysteine ligase (CTP)
VLCLVTAGPSFEPLDQVRRLTNFSTGRLGTELANSLARRGHDVRLLLGAQASWAGPRLAYPIEVFTTTADLQDHLAAQARTPVGAVFHAAAVSDFAFGQIWTRAATGELTPVEAGKLSSRTPSLLAELKPTPKIIAQLRDWFPQARLVGWKFEVDGERDSALAMARAQIRENRTDACVANGPAYGPGFGFVTADGAVAHLPDAPSLFVHLGAWLS